MTKEEEILYKNVDIEDLKESTIGYVLKAMQQYADQQTKDKDKEIEELRKERQYSQT